MKTIKRITTCLFVLALWLPVIAQKSDPDTSFHPDKKLPVSEQAILDNAGKDNPCKPSPWIPDPKQDSSLLPTEKDFGESNAKPQTDEIPDMKPLPEPEPSPEKASNPANPVESPVAQHEQPAGDTPGKEPVKRNTNGPNTQPPGEQPVTGNPIPKKGPDTQPAGEQPKK